MNYFVRVCVDPRMFWLPELRIGVHPAEPFIRQFAAVDPIWEFAPLKTIITLDPVLVWSLPDEEVVLNKHESRTPNVSHLTLYPHGIFHWHSAVWILFGLPVTNFIPVLLQFDPQIVHGLSVPQNKKNVSHI